jgi:hypothetical protein
MYGKRLRLSLRLRKGTEIHLPQRNTKVFTKEHKGKARTFG